ncbi:amidohydrolase family protein [Amycolatopsis pithecellobii]|uniref:Amidohydrolase family protein n=1 Tax=Amycolatopsis pithecellobii TaxID=664692 RepID=A0A6N7Z786_9PSEU|nr:amidohydrolase family protein [Amycolatopsis pithecellobii]MTD58009.1 amidohydrolase family protein [Amycolatopsis pithecellobii]
MTAPRRIDTHQHVIPDFYAEWLIESHGYFGGKKFSGGALPLWSKQPALDFMDRHSVATGVLSVSRPGLYFGEPCEYRAMVRRVNEFCAELKRAQPMQFGFFASLSLPDVEACLEEADAALGELGADGVVLFASVGGVYLGDPSFDPLMAELDRRGSVIFVHPMGIAAPPVPGIPPFLVDFLLDTTRAAVNMVMHGIPRRFPNLKIILSHAGGFLPYAAHRVAYSNVVVPYAGVQKTDLPADLDSSARPQTSDDFLNDLRTFYYDTALSTGSSTMAALLDFVGADRVLFGSDWPFAEAERIAHFIDELDGNWSISEEAKAKIARGNAARLFPRLR